MRLNKSPSRDVAYYTDEKYKDVIDASNRIYKKIFSFLSYFQK